ncbi:MAG: phosphohydrolase, partial [Firmicutes bacterium]|nr:phosphohydrolase [Bacillota bacterium]
NHSITGAVMAFRILDNMKMPAEDIADIVTAIGNHDEGTGIPASPVAAALILADKGDVRQSRVRNKEDLNFDIHDRVNYSVKKSSLRVSEDKTAIVLNLEIDTEISSIMDYFEIFLNRMVMCRKAAEKFGLEFKLIINEQQVV